MNTTTIALIFSIAIGLIAAIPAVVIYNHFSRQIAAYRLAVGDAGVGRSVDEALRVVHALRHVDAHPGAACPADWAPGAPGISTR